MDGETERERKRELGIKREGRGEEERESLISLAGV